MNDDIQRAALSGLFEHLANKHFCPHWRNRYDDQFWIELGWDCDRRPPDVSPRPVIEISIQDDKVTVHLGGIDMVDRMDRWLHWPHVELGDPESFEKVEEVITQIEKLVADNIDKNRRIDETAIISAFGPRPDMVR